MFCLIFLIHQTCLPVTFFFFLNLKALVRKKICFKECFTNVKQFSSECTPEEHKGDEEKSVKNTAGLDAVQSDVKEEKTKDLTDELNEVDQKIQKGRQTLEWPSPKQCAHKKYTCK